MINRRAFVALPALFALGASGALGACSSLETFNTLAPRDGQGHLVARDIAYGAGPRHMLDVYAPKAGATAAPVVVFFYGGSWTWGDRRDYRWVGAALAAQGFVAVLADYRLVPEVVFPAFVEDGAAAVRWTEANIGAYGGDPQKIVVMGHSAGAYNAIMLALDPRFGVQQSLAGAIGMAGPYDFLPFDVEASINAFGSYQPPEATQPVALVSAQAPPCLLLTGTDDDVVAPRNSEELARRLTAAGGVAAVKAYPGMNHYAIVLALSVPFRGRGPVLADVAGFVRQVTA
ncbi:MAG: alpha/beta hydrolase [Caulobacterales bacterium]